MTQAAEQAACFSFFERPSSGESGWSRAISPLTRTGHLV